MQLLVTNYHLKHPKVTFNNDFSIVCCMRKTTDLISILIIVIIGMFIPFLGSIVITFGLDFTNFNDLLKISTTFGWFLLIFGIELAVVFLYYQITNKIARKKLDNYKPK